VLRALLFKLSGQYPVTAAAPGGRFWSKSRNTDTTMDWKGFFIQLGSAAKLSNHDEWTVLLLLRRYVKQFRLGDA